MSDITAEDREAAEYYGKAVGYPDSDPTGDILRLAFARHRQRGRLMGLEEAANECEKAHTTSRDDAFHTGYNCAKDDLYTAIRKLKDQGHGNQRS